MSIKAKVLATTPKACLYNSPLCKISMINNKRPINKNKKTLVQYEDSSQRNKHTAGGYRLVNIKKQCCKEHLKCI